MSPRWWLRWAVFKAQVRDTTCAMLAMVCANSSLRHGLEQLPRLLSHLPRCARGTQYLRTTQNLELFDLSPTDIESCACRHMAIEWQKGIYQRRYPLRDPSLLRAWIRSITWCDPADHWRQVSDTPHLLVLLHTGEYWMAVARLVERYPAPTHFVIPIWNYQASFVRNALNSLEGLGHTVEVLDSNAPGTALCIARRLRQRRQVIIFSDLPVSLNASRSGEPIDGMLFGRAAQFVKGPMVLASRFGCDVLLAGHRVSLGHPGELHVIAHIACCCAQVMQAHWSKAFEDFIRQAPEHWFYLPHLEAFFQRQQRSTRHRPSLPAALRGVAQRGVSP